MTQQTIERMAIESGLANLIEPSNPAVLKFVAMVSANADSQEPVEKMTAHRAAFFMERFKREEKLLGPNEKAAVDFVIAMLDTHLQPKVFQDPVAWPIYGVRVDGAAVIITVKGGNDAARWLCGEILATHCNKVAA